MFKLIQQNREFFIGFCIWLIFGAILQIFFTQNDIIFWVNRHNSSILDILFKYITYLGDGAFYAITIVFLFAIKEKNASYIALIAFALITGVFVYFLKEFLSTPRPITVFANQMQGVHIVEGVRIAEWDSFPSGHTLSAFSVFLILSFVSKNKNWGYFYTFLSILVAYSRIYLFQHFAIDVYAGSIFGVGFTILIAYFFERKKVR